MPATYPLMDQAGKPVTSDHWLGKPFAVTAFYTRCQNPYKCPMVARQFGQLERRISEKGLSDKLKLFLVTYDPEYDSPERLKEYALSRGIRPGAVLSLVQPVPSQKQDFFSALGAAVNFDKSSVNLHGIQLMLFDKAGKFVRSYHTVLWDNDRVLVDLERLDRE